MRNLSGTPALLAAACMLVTLPAQAAPLDAYAGTYRVSALLAEPPVAAALARLPDATREKLRQDLEVTGPIVRDAGGWLLVRGIAAHLGTRQEAALAVRGDQVAVAILDWGHVTCVGGTASPGLRAAVRRWQEAGYVGH
jgi:hypothetical protein